MQTLHFNTGRQYSVNGQRIAAALLDGGAIIFVDIDRGLEYIIPAGAAAFNQAGIMAAYDGGGLEWCNGHALIKPLSDIAQSI